MVCSKSYDRSNSSILGYIAVNYPEEYTEGWQHDSSGAMAEEPVTLIPDSSGVLH